MHKEGGIVSRIDNLAAEYTRILTNTLARAGIIFGIPFNATRDSVRAKLYDRSQALLPRSKLVLDNAPYKGNHHLVYEAYLEDDKNGFPYISDQLPVETVEIDGTNSEPEFVRL